MKTLNPLRVTYNEVIRRLLGLHPWCSASTMFTVYDTRSFQEVARYVSFSLYIRISIRYNSIFCNPNNSDANKMSSIRKE